MGVMLWTCVLLVFCTCVVVSQAGGKCNSPTVYQGKVLDEKYKWQRDFNHGDTVEYRCARGYVYVRGSSFSVCHRGFWSPLRLQCKRTDVSFSAPYSRVTCPLLKTNKIMTFHGTKTTYKPGETLSFSCNAGFHLIGNTNVLRCEKNGKWNPNYVNCQLITCQRFTVPNGSVRFHGQIRFNTNVSITCEHGYRLKGPSIVTCGVNRSWTPALPTCEQVMPLRVTCRPPSVPNGNELDRHKIEYEVGERAVISCQEGYELFGSSQVTCGANRSWTPALPTCEQVMPLRVTCRPPSVPNGNELDRHKIEYEVGERAVISCQEGYELIGSSQVTCGEDGQWQETPECRFTEGKCPPPPYFSNAHTELGKQRLYEPDTVLRYRCNHGYRAVRGPSTIYCRNGRWTDLPLLCEKRKCGSAGEIDNGRYDYTGASFGDTATASCNKGYQLVGVGVRHCREFGWDGRAAVCEAIQCPDPPEVPNADVFFDSNDIIKYNYVASYHCHYGKLIGASDIVCTEDGTWNAPAPRCEVTCPDPGLWFGVIVSGQRSQYQSGNSVTFKCNPGKRLLGPDTIVCGTDGHWKPKLPQCVYWYVH